MPQTAGVAFQKMTFSMLQSRDSFCYMAHSRAEVFIVLVRVKVHDLLFVERRYSSVLCLEATELEDGVTLKRTKRFTIERNTSSDNWHPSMARTKYIYVGHRFMPAIYQLF